MRILWSKWRLTTVSSPEARGENRKQRDALLDELDRDLAITRRILLTGFSIGLLTVLFMWVLGTIPSGFTPFFWALACFAGGALLGFLFGIPRVFQRTATAEPQQLAPGQGSKEGTLASKPTRASYQLVVNTNLDDISDWLTKVAVGVGLVELEKIPHLIYRLAYVIASGMTAGSRVPPPVPFIMALLLYFSTAGFMSGYLTTRMFFQRAFRIADLRAAGSEGEEKTDAGEVVTIVEKAAAANAT